MTTRRLRSLFASPRLSVIIIEEVQLAVPRRQDKLILDHALFVVFCFADAPVHSGRNKFSFFVDNSGLLFLFFETFYFLTVLDVDRPSPSTLVAHKQFTVTLVHANACDVWLSQVSKDRLQGSIDSVPDFDAFGVRSDEGVENRVVQDANCCFFISQVMSCWFVVVVKDQLPTACYNSLWRLSNSETVDFVKSRTIESLNCCECTDVPDPEHAWNIRRDYLVRARHPFHANQWVIVALKQENLFIHVWVPNKHVVIETSWEDKMVFCIPI